MHVCRYIVKRIQMTTKTILIVCLFFSLLVFVMAPASFGIGLPTENICYDPSIKTIQVYKEGLELSPPIIQLNTTERLVISFDDLDPEIKRYKFTVLHCESDWKISADLLVSDFVEGFNEEKIDQFAYSYNTTVNYTHFETVFPTENMRPKVSGNYLLIVYEDDPSQLAFTARFMVVEPSPLVITGTIVQSTRIEDHFTRQQLDFIVRLNGFQVRDVEREIKVVVQQNGRWDNTLMISKPRFARPDELDYRYDESISFNGGNQYRYFDTKSLLYQSERIAKISYDTTNQVFLLDDLPRTYKQYTFEKDLNGRFFVKNEEHAENSKTEADYAWIHFFLPFPAPITIGQFHVVGELSYWQLNEDNKMTFNSGRKGYELNLFLKQGYYNYLYLLKENGRREGDESLIEGNHWETENDYTIYVYYHETGALYDRLISVSYFSTIL